MDAVLFLILSAAVIFLTLGLGILTGRKWRLAGTAAGICLPAALLLWVLFLSLRAGVFLPEGSGVPLPMLGFCAFCSATACLCAFSPKRPWYILGTAEGALASLMVLPLLLRNPELWLFLAGGAGLLSLYFAIAGAVFSASAWKPEPLPVSGTVSVPPSRPAVPARPQSPRVQGAVTMLAGEFAGQTIFLRDKEPLHLGADPAFAHFVLGDGDCPPRLCSIRWLQASNTYLVTCLTEDVLWYIPEHFLPAGGTFQVIPGTVFCLRRPIRLFRVG